eukprot:9426770-Pyramimonas_sp.AAC.1
MRSPPGIDAMSTYAEGACEGAKYEGAKRSRVEERCAALTFACCFGLVDFSPEQVPQVVHLYGVPTRVISSTTG